MSNEEEGKILLLSQANQPFPSSAKCPRESNSSRTLRYRIGRAAARTERCNLRRVQRLRNHDNVVQAVSMKERHRSEGFSRRLAVAPFEDLTQLLDRPAVDLLDFLDFSDCPCFGESLLPSRQRQVARQHASRGKRRCDTRAGRSGPATHRFFAMLPVGSVTGQLRRCAGDFDHCGRLV
jgi:hypothetical protein